MSAADTADRSRRRRSPPAGHRGRIEVVEFGTRFLLVSGWVTGRGPRAGRRHLASRCPMAARYPVGSFLPPA